jgi:hypothetical protein
MPGSVVKRKRADPESQATYFVESVDLPDNMSLFEVSFTDQMLSTDPDVVFDQAWSSMARLWQASITDDTPLQYKGHHGRDLRFVCAGTRFRTGAARLLLVNRGERQRLYIIALLGPEGFTESDDAQIYFDSFYLLDDI